MTGHSVDLYAPETLAATAGSVFALPTLRQASHHEVLPFLEHIRAHYGDLQIVATSAKATQAVYDCSFWRPTVLLIGNETSGLSRAYLDLADSLVTIPMQGSASSLNVACATTVLLYEIARQRGTGR
jgi:TrmH family RNA methyltransferase